MMPAPKIKKVITLLSFQAGPGKERHREKSYSGEI